MKESTKTIIEFYASQGGVYILLDRMQKILKAVETGEYEYYKVEPNLGLCTNILKMQCAYPFTKIISYWPNHSGHHLYPVKSGSKTMGPKEMYFHVSNCYVGAYGKRRINLLKWLIKEFEIAVEHLNKR